METAIGRLPVGSFVIGFLIYIISHLLIGWYKTKQEKKQSREGLSSDEEQQLKYIKIIFRWWPAACVVLVVAMLYFA